MKYTEYMGETFNLIYLSPEKLSADTRAFIDAADARKNRLPEEQRMLFGDRYWNCDLMNQLVASLQAGEKPSVFFQQRLSQANGTCILPRWWDAFLWAIDACRGRP